MGHLGDDVDSFSRILKDLGNDCGSSFGMIFGLVSKFVLAELRFTVRPWRVREAKRILITAIVAKPRAILERPDEGTQRKIRIGRRRDCYRLVSPEFKHSGIPEI